MASKKTTTEVVGKQTFVDFSVQNAHWLLNSSGDRFKPVDGFIEFKNGSPKLVYLQGRTSANQYTRKEWHWFDKKMPKWLQQLVLDVMKKGI